VDQVCLDHLVFLVLKAKVDLVEILDHLVFKDLQDQRVVEDHLAQLVQEETKEALVNVVTA